MLIRFLLVAVMALLSQQVLAEGIYDHVVYPEQEKDVVLYQLVSENVRPEPDEFYLSTIYGTSNNPRALIKRSNNIRSGDLFTGTVEYTIGDKISEEYMIHDIDFRLREVIVKHVERKEYYALKLTYGLAKSKLIRKYDYAPEPR